MAPTLFVILVLLISINFSTQSLSEPFFSVSTTDRSSDCCQDHEARISKLEEQILQCQRPSSKVPKEPTGNFPKNCQEVQQRGHTKSTFYKIQPSYASEPFTVLCNMKSDGGGWTYILNRYDGSQDFYLDWNDFKNGFGNLSGEFWLGLEKIHLLTGYESNELLIELVDWGDVHVTARYRSFGVDNEDNDYALKSLGGYSGDAGDSFHVSAGMKFTTRDRDNDKWVGGNCAHWSNSGWWHHICNGWGQLTGIYRPRNYGPDNTFKAMFWWNFRQYTGLKQARMMVRPVGKPTQKNPAL